MWISECVEWFLCQRGLFSTSDATWMFTWRWIPCFLMSWCLCLDCIWPSFWLLFDSRVLVSVTARVSVPVTVAIFRQQTYEKVVVFFNCGSYTDFFFFFDNQVQLYSRNVISYNVFLCPQAYEKGIALFKWPNVFDIWNTYLTKFIDRYVSLFFFIFIFLSFFLYSFIYIWSACLTKFINRNASHFSP